MKIALICSLVINGLLAVLAGTAFSQVWRLTEYHDRRPQGALCTLAQDHTVYDRAGHRPAFVLPKGVVVQESTSGGLATLGKPTEREFILIIRSDEQRHSADPQADPGWMDLYRADISNGANPDLGH